MIAAVEEMMVKRRGFPRFAELDKFLIPLYRDRPKGKTLADVYPRIIDWFAKSRGEEEKWSRGVRR
jgi:hypothetical protein